MIISIYSSLPKGQAQTSFNIECDIHVVARAFPHSTVYSTSPPFAVDTVLLCMQFAVEGYLLILCLGLFSPATGTLELTAQGFQLWNHDTHTNMYYYSSTGGCNLQNAECRTQQRIKSAVLCNKQNKHLLKTPLLHILPLHVQSLNPNQRKEGIIWHSFCRLMAGILHGIPLVLWLPCLQYDTVSNKCTSSCWVPFTAKSPLRTSKRHRTSHVVITTSPILRRKKRSPGHGLLLSPPDRA